MLKCTTIFLTILIYSCSNHGKLNVITDLPKRLNENSGIVSFNNESAWLVEDGGNKNEIYKTNFKGEIVKKLSVKKAENIDWEDLAKDNLGNIYIGDIGNNENKRKNLVVYKIPNPEVEKGNKIKAEAISFYYPEQTKFPPKKKGLYYDAEALFYQNKNLYIITKNRANPFNGEALVYKIPAKKGKHAAQLIDTFKMCSDWNYCQITSADISPDGKKLVLLSYGRLYVITNFTEDNFSKGKMETIDLQTNSQLESICFIDNTKLLLSDEKKGPTGRNLYSYTLK